MNDSDIDPFVFETLQANAGADFAAQLVEAFAEEAPLLAGQMRAAAAIGDATQFENIAHSLKSNGVTFGAGRLTALAAGLERQGVAMGEAGQAALDELAAEIANVVRALRAAAQP